MTINNETFFALVEERLAAGERVTITLAGTSMQPTLVAGDVI
jgi:phage repressor protein C with HTH and peptisase S24 domain